MWSRINDIDWPLPVFVLAALLAAPHLEALGKEPLLQACFVE